VVISPHGSLDRRQYIRYPGSVRSENHAPSSQEQSQAALGISSSVPETPPDGEIHIVPDSQSLHSSSSYIPTAANCSIEGGSIQAAVQNFIDNPPAHISSLEAHSSSGLGLETGNPIVDSSLVIPGRTLAEYSTRSETNPPAPSRRKTHRNLSGITNSPDECVLCSQSDSGETFSDTHHGCPSTRYQSPNTRQDKDVSLEPSVSEHLKRSSLIQTSFPASLSPQPQSRERQSSAASPQALPSDETVSEQSFETQLPPASYSQSSREFCF
jgi:hypothetical protein